MNQPLTIYYYREQAQGGTLEELDSVLDRITDTATAEDYPVYASLTAKDERQVLDVGLGRADYSVLIWYDDDAAEVRTSQGTVPTPENAAFDYGGTWTDAPLDSAIPVELARQAAREFISTGQRPTCVAWQQPRYV